ncbi:hypothetical protein F4774DRAFT_396032 [Daldinia eschscholtzii]|nr:hypothetical protein F4774DRAFT_396032 [Daldinia eschscholtzii]
MGQVCKYGSCCSLRKCGVISLYIRNPSLHCLILLSGVMIWLIWSASPDQQDHLFIVFPFIGLSLLHLRSFFLLPLIGKYFGKVLNYRPFS